MCILSLPSFVVFLLCDLSLEALIHCLALCDCIGTLSSSHLSSFGYTLSQMQTLLTIDLVM